MPLDHPRMHVLRHPGRSRRHLELEPQQGPAGVRGRDEKGHRLSGDGVADHLAGSSHPRRAYTGDLQAVAILSRPCPSSSPAGRVGRRRDAGGRGPALGAAHARLPRRLDVVGEVAALRGRRRAAATLRCGAGSPPPRSAAGAAAALAGLAVTLLKDVASTATGRRWPTRGSTRSAGDPGTRPPSRPGTRPRRSRPRSPWACSYPRLRKPLLALAAAGGAVTRVPGSPLRVGRAGRKRARSR